MGRQTDGCSEQVGKIVGARAGGDAAKFDDLLGCEPRVEICDTAGLRDAEHEVILRWNSDVLKFAGVKFNARLAQKLLEEKSADEMADRQSIGSRGFVDIVGRDHASGAGHIFNQNRRVAGNVFAHMAADCSRVSVVTAAGGETDDHTNGLAFVKVRLGNGVRSGES